VALTEDQILAQNPWWTNVAWRGADPQLVALGEQPVRLPSGFAIELEPALGGVHVLRGPRQVGKTTALKLLVARALEQQRPARSVIYLTLDLLEGQDQVALVESVKRAKRLARHDGASIVLLDEVTAIDRWQRGVKAIWDDGTIRGDVVVCTGSSAIDLQRGAAERLPGRRGEGADHLLLPQSFAAFAQAVNGSIPKTPRLYIADLVSEAGQEVISEAHLHGPALRDALERFLLFGGLPAAVAEASLGVAEPSAATKRVLHDSLVSEVQRRGGSVPGAHALLERVVRSLGSKTDWSKLARELQVPLGRSPRRGPTSHTTLRDYVELLAGGYFLFIAYFWRNDSQTNSLSNAKKVFFADPLLHTVALDHMPGRRPDVAAMVENAVGFALYRRYEGPDRLIESFVSPDRLHIWKTAKGGEVDFVAGPRQALDVVEVKYQHSIDLRGASSVAKAHPGRPVVIATKEDLAFRDGYALIPAHLLLWALG